MRKTPSLPTKRRSSAKEALSLKDVRRVKRQICAASSADGEHCLLFLPVLMIIRLQADIEKLSQTAKSDLDFKKMKGGLWLNPGCGYFIEQQLTKYCVCRTPRTLERADRWNWRNQWRKHQTEWVWGLKAQRFHLSWPDPTFLPPVFVLLAQRDEIAKLKIQEDRQTQANMEKIKGGRGTFIPTCSSIDTSRENKPFFWLCQRSGEQSGRLHTADSGQNEDAWLQQPEGLRPV